MARIRTHYDNLKVSRDAPIEVIRAAFRSLAAKYHPDVNPGNSEAAKTMRIINASYEVLSDPTKRAEHDRWIRTQGILEEPKDEYAEYVNQRWPQPSPTPRESPRSRPRAKPEVTSAWRRFSRFLLGWLASTAAVVIVVGLGWWQQSSETPHPPATADYDALAQKYGGNDASNFRGGTLQAVPKPLSPRPHYQRPALAPNGSPWPRSSGYLLEQSEDGNSVITVDNSRNDSDMLVKLFDHRFKRPAAVRMIFLRAHEEFTFENVEASGYDIRYQDLDSGVISKSRPFNIEEHSEDVRVPGGIDHVIHKTNYRLTLYKVLNGNTDVEVIGPDDF